VLVAHAFAARRSVQTARALSSISGRLRASSDAQVRHLPQMQMAAEKYLVTRDRGYLERMVEVARELGDETLEESVARLASDSTPPTPLSLARFEQRLEETRGATQRLREASQAAMTRELAEAERAASNAQRVAWLVTAGALLLTVLLSVALIRAIVRPLGRLATGTREIAAGRLGYRLHASAVDARDEFAQVARDFNAMAERLEEVDRLKRELVSNVSHDLKTPLTSVQETTAALLDGLPGPLSEPQRRLLLHSQESGRRLSSMVTKLLDLSRLESRRAPELEVLDVVELTRRAVDRATMGRTARGPVVTLEPPDGELLLRADADGLDRVLDNLLENAVKFSPPEGTVRVTIAGIPQDGGNVLLTVADEGPGIRDADKEKVFERFYQTEVGRAARSHGVGLGLSICRHIVAEHGGKIWVTDNEPRGASFVVLLSGLAA
jgi:signal transduction histidine kinase